MKKLGLLILAAATLFAFSCSGALDAEKDDDSKNDDPKMGTLVFSSSVARSIFPDVTKETFTNVVLKGKFGDEAEKQLGTWKSISAFEAAKIEVKLGTWNLTLSATKESVVFTDTKAVTVNSGENPVSFALKKSSWGTGTGTISATLTVPDAVKAATFTLKKLNETSNIESVNGSLGTPTNGKVIISYEKSGLSATNQYDLSVTFYGDSAKTKKLNEVSEVFTVGTGLVSTWTAEFKDLNSLETTYKIIYNLNGGTIDENYSQFYTESSSAITLPTPTKSGYTFNGWFENSTYTGTAVTQIAAGSKGDKSFWAKWGLIPLPSNSEFFPDKNATNVYEDETICITFDAVPTLGTGNITISDGTNTQTISIKDTTQNTQSDGTNTRNTFKSNDITYPLLFKNFNVQVVDKRVIIIPAAPLENGKTYTITIPSGAISGKINGTDFAGVSDWTFTTRAKRTPSSQLNIVVDCNPTNNSADFRSVSGAMRAVTSDATIKVAPGTYRENIYFKKNYNLKIEGTGSAAYGSDVILQGMNCVAWNNSTDARPSFWFGGKNLTLKNVTIQNAYTRSMESTGNNQAEAIYFNSNGKLVAYNSSFKSFQDTILTKGKNWFYKCYIEGDVDFMWGYADVALFEECSIKTLGTSAGGSSAAYLFETRVGNTSANTVGKGYVLYNSTVDVGTTTYFARRATAKTNPTDYYDQVAIIDTRFTANGGSVATNLWSTGNEPEYIDEGSEMPVGWKAYGGSGYTVKTGSAYGTISQATHDKEYNGRNVILNSVYNKTSKTYERAAEIWDVTSLATEFNATADTSSLPTATSETYVWDFTQLASLNMTSGGTLSKTSGTGSSSIIATVSAGKLAYNSAGCAEFGSGTTISIPVSNGDIIEVEAYNANNSYQSITIDGIAMTGLTSSKTITADGTCVIASTANSKYITKITLTKKLSGGNMGGGGTGGSGTNWLWNASDYSTYAGDITSPTTLGKITLGNCDASNKFTLETDSKKADGIDFSYRLKTNGSGSNTKRTISFDVTGACTIRIYVITGSNNTERTVTCVNSSNQQIGTVSNSSSSDFAGQDISYTGEADTLTLYTNAAMNFYAISVTYGTSGGNTGGGGGGTSSNLEVVTPNASVTTYGWADVGTLKYPNTTTNVIEISDSKYPTASAKATAFRNAISKGSAITSGGTSNTDINNTPAIIILSGTVDLSGGLVSDTDHSYFDVFNSSTHKREHEDFIFYLGANKTILGVNNAKIAFGGLTFKPSSTCKGNIIIRNVTFWDAHGSTELDTSISGTYKDSNNKDKNYSDSKASADNFVIEGSDDIKDSGASYSYTYIAENIWIDHCKFTDGTCDDLIRNLNHDGALDVKAVHNMTISYCEFTNHDKVTLLAPNDSYYKSEDRQITFHHNYYHHATQRMPRSRGCQVHVYNNYYDDIGVSGNGGFALGPGIGSQFIVENTNFGTFTYNGNKYLKYFDSSTSSSAATVSHIYASGNSPELSDSNSTYDSSTEKVSANSNVYSAHKVTTKPWTITYSYTSNMQSASELPSTIPTVAGPTLKGFNVNGTDYQ